MVSRTSACSALPKHVCERSAGFFVRRSPLGCSQTCRLVRAPVWCVSLCVFPRVQRSWNESSDVKSGGKRVVEKGNPTNSQRETVGARRQRRGRVFFENFNGALALLVLFSCSPAFFAPLSGGREWGRGGSVGSEAFGKPTNGARKDVEKRKHEREKKEPPRRNKRATKQKNTTKKKKNQHFHQNKGLQARSASFKAGIVREVARGRRRIVSSAQKAAGCAVGSDASD